MRGDSGKKMMSDIAAPPGGFGPEQPSRTSITVAALRAFGAREPDPSVRNPDWLAERLLGPHELSLIAEHPIVEALKQDYPTARKKRAVEGMSNLLLIRTRFIDDRLQHELANGARQIVILGAGFDTRAYRYADVLKDTPVFEVDYASTQAIKMKRLSEAIPSLPSNVHFVEIDFERDTLPDVLNAAGCQPNVQTFFIWEGVSMYLSEHSVKETLKAIASYTARGSALVMDFAGRAMVDLLQELPRLQQHRYTTAWGEPWIFGVPDGREEQFFLDSGFQPREILSYFGREASRRYLTRADGTAIGTVRGQASMKDLPTLLRLIWRFITRSSKWYAIADLLVVH